MADGARNEQAAELTAMEEVSHKWLLERDVRLPSGR